MVILLSFLLRKLLRWDRCVGEIGADFGVGLLHQHEEDEREEAGLLLRFDCRNLLIVCLQAAGPFVRLAAL